MRTRAECCCGACSIDVQGEPEIYAVCNCSNCKKRTGSAFGLSAYFKEAAVVAINGEMLSYRLSSKSGRQERKFCAECGTTLLWYSEPFKGMVGIAGGCFAGNPLPAPQFMAHNEARCSWVSFSEAIRVGFGAEDLPRA